MAVRAPRLAIQLAPESWNMGLGGFRLGCPSSRGFGVGGQSHSNFLASTVELATATRYSGRRAG